MGNSDEYLDVVDENNNVTGEKVEYEKAHLDGICHREVGAFIFNNKNEILMQKRSSIKKQHPNTWAICAGHVDLGESPEDGMLREIQEEIGVKFNKEDLEYGFLEKRCEEFPNRINNCFSYTYYIKSDLRIEDCKIELSELSELKYFTLDEFKDMIKTNSPKNVYYYKEYKEEVDRVISELEKKIKEYSKNI